MNILREDGYKGKNIKRKIQNAYLYYDKEWFFNIYYI